MGVYKFLHYTEQHRKHTLVEPQQCSLISVNNLNADFTSLLLNVTHILDNSPNQQHNLKVCKDYCTLLRCRDSSNESLFSAETTANIKESSDFRQLFDILIFFMSWDEHSILTHIVDICDSVEGQQEIERFEKKLALFQALQIMSDTSKQSLSYNFAKFCEIINKPYKKITIEKYKEVKAYIFSNLNVRAYVTVGFIRKLYH